MALVLKDVINIGTARLESSGCSSPKLDAEVLLSYYLKADRSFLFAHFSDDLDDKRCEAYFELIDIRAAGVPVPYITGVQEFMGISFKVDQNVLIPRPDTETLVEEAIKIVKEKHKLLGTIEILDLCCGSGAICVSMGYYLPKVKFEASDISKKALEIAKRNAADYSLSSRIKFFQGDLFAPIKKGRFGKGRFDMIVTNPPYISSDIVPTLQREIVEFEPMIALDGGGDGLSYYRRIITEAPAYLKKTGLLMMEIGYDQSLAVCSLAAEDGRYAEAEVLRDLAGNDRVVKVKLLDTLKPNKRSLPKRGKAIRKQQTEK
jgi:release factor glutamine methyltransferase